MAAEAYSTAEILMKAVSEGGNNNGLRLYPMNLMPVMRSKGGK